MGLIHHFSLRPKIRIPTGAAITEPVTVTGVFHRKLSRESANISQFPPGSRISSSF